MNYFSKEIDLAARKYYAEGNPKRLKAAVMLIADKYGQNQQTAFNEMKKAETEIKNEWLKGRVKQKDAPLSDIAVKEFNAESLAKFGGGVNKKLLNIINESSKNRVPEKELRKRIKTALDSEQYQANTLARTLTFGSKRLRTGSAALQSGNEYFQLLGNSANPREFCAAHLGRIYHISEILRMNNGQGLSVFIFCGGFNCKHHWQAYEGLKVDENVFASNLWMANYANAEKEKKAELKQHIFNSLELAKRGAFVELPSPNPIYKAGNEADQKLLSAYVDGAPAEFINVNSNSIFDEIVKNAFDGSAKKEIDKLISYVFTKYPLSDKEKSNLKEKLEQYLKDNNYTAFDLRILNDKKIENLIKSKNN